MIDFEKLGEEIATLVHGAVKAAVDPLIERISVIENQPAQSAEKGDPGRDGSDGKDAPAVTDDAIAMVVAKYLTENPVAKGIDGKDGVDGKPGADGTSPTSGEITDAVVASFERRFADLSISWERQARDMAEKAIDRMPVAKDGADGKDGRSVDQPAFEYDGRREFTIKTMVDGQEVSETFRLPIVIDAGFYAEGKDYEPGDGVTFGGSYWIAQKDTGTKPEIGNTDWRLSVRKGRDAKVREVKL